MDADVFPASSSQERLWFLSRFEPEVGVYNIGVDHPLTETDAGLLRRSLEEVVRRHEALRTSLEFRDGGLVQLVHPTVPVTVEASDLSHEPGEYDRLASADAALPFQQDRAPLWRARVVRLRDDESRLIWVADHAIFDAISTRIFFDELEEVCRSLAAGRRPDLAEPPVQFADYAAWQRAQDYSAQLAYWRTKLAGLPDDIALPGDRPRPSRRSYRGGVHRFQLGAQRSAGVDGLARDLGATPFMVLLAAFKAVLARWAGHGDIVVGTPVAGRPVTELKRVIGMFVNMLVLRDDLGDDPPFRSLVHRVRETVLAALEHQDVPFERLVEELAPRRDPRVTPLFQVMFNLPPGNTEGQLFNGTSKVDLQFDLNVRAGIYHGRVDYSADLFEPATIERAAEAFQVVVAAVVDNPGLPMSRLPLMTGAERIRVLQGAVGADAHVPAARPVGLVEHRAEHAPDSSALVFRGRTLTYAELNGRAERLASRLVRLGGAPEEPVALLAERSLDLVVGMLATLKTGAVLVPLDPEYPAERLAFMLADGAPGIVLTQSHLDTVPSWYSGQVVVLDRDDPPSASGPALPYLAALPDGAAYIIYTSGSTGRPKGVVTTNRGIVNRLDWMQKAYPLDGSDRVLHKTPISFDVAVWELLWPLITGAQLVLAPPGDHRDPARLRDLIIEAGVTVTHFVPSMLAVFLATAGIDRCVSLRRVICSGEELPQALVNRCAEVLPAASLHNLYGPTEAAIDVTSSRCRPTATGRVSIGSAVQNTRLHVLDRRLEPLPVGMPGELHIAGVQLARGYHGGPGRTAAAFTPDPYGPPGSRLYKTGDLCRLRPDGALDYLGRADRQVKIHGVRVELSEIEAVLAEHPDVRRGVVVARDDAPGGRGLVAYVEWAGDPASAAQDLRQALITRLPRSVVPSSFVLVDALPTLPSGKLDRAALPAPPVDDRSGVAAPYAPPRTPLEEELAVLWGELLGRAKVGVDDDFFELGGHSLLAVELVTRIWATHGVEIPLHRCFEITTVSGYALAILELLVADQDLGELLGE